MKRKIAAIMAADIAGYSKLVAEDEEETLRRLASYRSVFDDFIAKAAGRVFNTAGDAVLAEFPSAVEAVRCAIDIQESLRTRNMAFPPSRQMNFRIGITVGDVVERDGDLLGDGVNIAARLQTLAQPGGICVSRSIYEQVTNKLSVHFSDIGEQQVKNIPTPIHAYMVAVTGVQEPVPAPKKTRSATVAVAAVLAGVAVLAAAGGIYYVKSKPTPVAASAPGPAVATAAPPASATSSAPLRSPMGAMPMGGGMAASKTPPQQPPPKPKLALTDTPPATLPVNEDNVRKLAAAQNILLPHSIHIMAPPAAMAKKTAEYLGVWGGELRWGGRGRHMMLVVTSIDGAGHVSGIYSYGPPTPHTFNQSPPNYWGFNGTVGDDGVKFESPDGQWKYRFTLMPGGLMQGLSDSPKNTHPRISLERIN
jgi:class 3 adenylate cyclase